MGAGLMAWPRGCSSDDEDISRLGLKPLCHPQTQKYKKKHKYQNIQLHKCTITEIQKYKNTERGCPSDDEDISRLGLKPLRHPHTYNTHVATMWEFNIKYDPLYRDMKIPQKNIFSPLCKCLR